MTGGDAPGTISAILTDPSYRDRCDFVSEQRIRVGPRSVRHFYPERVQLLRAGNQMLPQFADKSFAL